MNTTILRRKDWWLSGDLSRVEVWKIDTSDYIPDDFKNRLDKPGYERYKFGWIDPKTLSYNTRPKRNGLLTTFDLNEVMEKKGSDETIDSPEFECKEDSIQSFEIVCASPNCLVDLWQDKEVPVGSGELMDPPSPI